jgi:hypothetical protein
MRLPPRAGPLQPETNGLSPLWLRLGTLLSMSHSCTLLVWVLCVLGSFSLSWFCFRRDFRNRYPGANVALDPVEADPSTKKAVPGGFEPHMRRYQDLAKLLLTLAAATIAFLVNFLAGIPVGGKRNVYSLGLEKACPCSIALLGLSAICAILFLLSENYAYETYCHDPMRDTYKPSWYAFNLSLAFWGFVSFFLAYAWLALRVFW